MTDAHLSLSPAGLRSEAGASSFDDAFRVEFEQHHASLARYLGRLIDDPGTAADLAQEAFVRLYTRGALPDNARSWLVTVAHNLLRNQRREARTRTRILAAHASEIIDEPSAVHDADAEREDQRARVRAALGALPERERRLLLLRYEGFSYRELSDALGIRESSVGTLLARAKEAFRTALTGAAHASE